VNVVPPAITGTLHEGQTLTCSTGDWNPPATAYQWQWTRNGTPIAGATAQTYVVVGADVGMQVGCTVTATNEGGSTPASAVPVAVPVPAPVNVVPPAITGTLHKGQTLTCSTGHWNRPGTAYQWQWTRNGTPIAAATAHTHVVVGADVDTQVGCTVTTTNEGGSTPASAVPVVVTRIAAAILVSSSRRQEGPTLRFDGWLRTEQPARAGRLELLRREAGALVFAGKAAAGPFGRFRVDDTIHALVPGTYAFVLRFVPTDPKLYDSVDVPLSVTAVSPRTYPFPRSALDRATTLFDHLAPFWLDGGYCSIGCRPAGAIPGWPLKPFHEQHALRAGINEWRASGFHRGIDIQARDYTPVYAIQSGYVHIVQARGDDERVQVGNYIYWHVKIRVPEGAYIRAYGRSLGIVLRYIRHLHLSEVDSAGRYLNPLRPLGRDLSPWVDLEPPVIGRPELASDGSATVLAYDPQSYLTQTRYLTPVLAPAALGYRIFDAQGRELGPLQWALRGTHVLPVGLIPAVFTADARPPGYACFALRVVCIPHWRYRLAGGLAPRVPPLPHGRYRLTAYAWDWAGNTTARDLWFDR
jgi:hypothetical protein